MYMKARQRGFSLIEALVALVVLSIGLLGAAGLQLKALQSATQGYQSSLVSIASLDAQQRIWKLRANAASCSAIDLSAEESQWKNQWFADRSENPLRNVDEANASMTSLGDCQFSVSIELPPRGDETSQTLSYRFEILQAWEEE